MLPSEFGPLVRLRTLLTQVIAALQATSSCLDVLVVKLAVVAVLGTILGLALLQLPQRPLKIKAILYIFRANLPLVINLQDFTIFTAQYGRFVFYQKVVWLQPIRPLGQTLGAAHRAPDRGSSKVILLRVAQSCRTVAAEGV